MFGHSMFRVFEVQYFGVCSKTTRNRYRNDHFRKFLLFQLWQYSNAFSNCSFERTNNRSQREIKGGNEKFGANFSIRKGGKRGAQ